MVKVFLFLFYFSVSLFGANYSFANINLNYFDWQHKAESEADQGDFSYVGFEGGVGWDGIDTYGFFNIENPLKSYNDESPDDLRFTGFGDVDVELGHNIKLHFQDYGLHSESFYVNDFVLGIGYKLSTDFGMWIRPFVGFHHTYSSYYDGLNGYMGGWLFNYDFKVFGKKCTIFQWNEIEFARDKEFYLDENNQPTGDGDSWGLNGAISGWFFFNDTLAAGIQYRYAKNKLGSSVYQAGTIYTVKYYFK